MSFLAAAALGSSIASGLGSRRARKEAEQRMDQALDTLQGSKKYIDDFMGLADKFMQIGQDSLDRYNRMFQPLEETIHDYYMNLDPSEFAGQANQTAQQQYQQAMQQVNDQMAARGLSTSGIGSQMSYDLANQMAQTKAQNIMNAPHQVAQMQQGWMNYGANRQDNAFNQLNQGMGYQQSGTNMYNNLAANIANMQSGMGAQQYGLANQGMQSAGQGLGAAMYFGGRRPMGADGKLGQSLFDKWGW